MIMMSLRKGSRKEVEVSPPSASATSTTTSTTSSSTSTSADQSVSNIRSKHRQEEVRGEVEALVRRVVPEEADNIDEMLAQFKGREEELVEKLRRMQERAIARRARRAVQMVARVKANSPPRSSAKVLLPSSASPPGQSAKSVGSTKSEC